MKVKLTNVKLEKVAEGKQNAGSIYVTADLRQVNNIFAGSWRHQPFFEEELVSEFRQYFDTEHFGTGEKIGQPLPDDLLYIDNCLNETYMFPEIMVRLDEMGKPIKNKFGNICLYRSCNIFTMKYFDDREKQWLYIKGRSLEERGQRIMNSFYAPARLFRNDMNCTYAPVATVQSLRNSENAPQPTT